MSTRDEMDALATESGWTLTARDDQHYDRGNIRAAVAYDRAGRIQDLTRMHGSTVLDFWPRYTPNKSAILREWLTDPA